jgi:hypothetical protein
MTAEQVEKQIGAGTNVFWRKCGACGDSMFFTVRKGRPCLMSCTCRPKSKSNIIDYSWDDLRMLIDHGRIIHK